MKVRIKKKKNPSFKLIDFQIYNDKVYNEETEKDEYQFMIQMFAMNEQGENASIFINDFKPFFYLKVSNKIKKNTERAKEEILNFIKKTHKTKWYEKEEKRRTNYKKYYFQPNIRDCKLVKRKDLYGFDNNKDYYFLYLSFNTLNDYNQIKRLWTNNNDDEDDKYNKKYKKKHNKKGELIIDGKDSDGISIMKHEKLKIYEAAIPPFLRYFHMRNINPAGWITFVNKVALSKIKKTNCKYEYTTSYKNIRPQHDKEFAVPMKTCSFDIEASSSHGDFPLAKKTYEKLTGQIVAFWISHKNIENLEYSEKTNLFVDLFNNAFGFSNTYKYDISPIYPKEEITETKLSKLLNKFISKEKIIDILDDEQIKPEDKKKLIDELIIPRDKTGKKETEKQKYKFPDIEGDTVTFIGSTFKKITDDNIYLNHMVVLNSCDDVPEVPNRVIESYDTEEELLLGWTKMIQREDPNIIIGYNTFGFDWSFMIDRADELGIKEEFLNLSKNLNEECKVVKSTTTVASGTYEDVYAKIPGRIQIDLLNYFRKEVNLDSYKLDFVASHFISDKVSDYNVVDDISVINSKNLTGLETGHFVSFQIIAHSSDMYLEGKKFKIFDLDKENHSFKINHKLDINKKLTIKWCLNKDDIDHHQIFEYTKQGPDKRAIIAKYCYQDCNLCHTLMSKNDIITGVSELSSICSVPMDFIIRRGQGIRLLSFIAKKCREKKTLMPFINKSYDKSGYEGAIVLPPKKGFYKDKPVAVVDYASLYPSSMISENISHDSKVWSKEYDLNGNPMINPHTGRPIVWGMRDIEGNFIYDNLPNYKYVDIQYDTFTYKRKHPKAAAKKIKTGYKICRFAQFPNGEKAIMPSVLSELLKSRKATKKLAKHKTLITKEDRVIHGLLKKNETHHVITTEDNDIIIIENKNVKSVEDRFNDFMKNVLDKRQLSKKIVANSLYGQCGAKTSSFYEKDIAASTTATGRKLLYYAKDVIEGCYGDTVVPTKNHGSVKSKAEYVYGDSVTKDTPLLLRNKHTGNIEFKEISQLSNKEEWRSYDGFKAGESNRKEKQQKYVEDYQIYTSNGWSDINRVIRHKTTKKIYRITTHTGMVDVTEDHSLLDENKDIIKPKDTKIGMNLLHNYPTFKTNNNMKLSNFLDYIENIQYKTKEEKRAFIYGFFFGDGSCGKYDCPSGIKYSWALNNQNYKLLSKLRTFCIDEFGFNFKINNTFKSSGVYKLVPNGGQTKKNKLLIIQFRDNCYNENKYKIVPIEFLNANQNIKFAYLSGYYAADGSKCNNEKAKNIRLSNKGKIGSSMLFYMFKSLGLNVSVNTRKDKTNITRLTITSSKQRKNPNVLKKVDELYTIENNNFVYDIETETGNFNTGYPLIVKNTDSVFFTFNLEDMDGNKIIGKKALEITIELAVQAGEIATKFLKPPHDLEYEKTFDPFLLLSKKRYVGMLHEFDINKSKRKSMGIVLKRRDNAPVVKDCYGGIIDILMKEHNVNKAVEFTKNFLNDMVNEKFSLDKLLIRKALRQFYKNPKQVAHKVLADRIGKREPGNKPAVGSRVPFIYIQTKGNPKLQGDRIEDPIYIKNNNLKPDFSHYITNQIQKPVQQVFCLILEDITEFKPNIGKLKRFQRGLERQLEKELITEEKCDEKITKEREKWVNKLIFEYYVKKSKQQAKNNAKKSFFQLK